MADAVKRALEAAGRAAWEQMDTMGWEPPYDREAEKIASHAIAAFLRALPTGSGEGLVEFGDDDTVWCGAIDQLAAAVTRAAQEDSKDER